MTTTLPTKNQKIIERFLARVNKRPQSAVAESIGVSPQDLSTWKMVSRAIGLDCPPAKVGAKKGAATTERMAAVRAAKTKKKSAHLTIAALAKTLRSSKTNGAHAR
jgi:hypothetical protein